MDKKPFITRDTKEPLVVLGGYKIVEGGSIERELLGSPSELPQATKSDLVLWSKYGPAGLMSRGLFGVIDRLRNSGLFAKENNDE